MPDLASAVKETPNPLPTVALVLGFTQPHLPAAADCWTHRWGNASRQLQGIADGCFHRLWNAGDHRRSICLNSFKGAICRYLVMKPFFL